MNSGPLSNTCYTVGDYCSQRVLFACVEETTTSCCFSTLLARIIQEQGRAQLGIGWGDGDSPECRGLTVEELQRIDFSRIDLSGYIRDLEDLMRWPTAEEPLHRQGQVTGADYRGRAAEAPPEVRGSNLNGSAGLTRCYGRRGRTRGRRSGPGRPPSTTRQPIRSG